MKKLLAWILILDTFAYTHYKSEIENGNLKYLRKICSSVGLPIPLFSMLILISYFGYYYIGFAAVIIIVISYLFSGFVNLIIKAFSKRDRPPNHNFWSPLPYDKYSFPSGHAAGTMAVAISLGHFVPELRIALIVWATIIGISRFFGDFHHPTDILVGFVVGIISSILLRWIGSPLFRLLTLN